MSLHWSALKWMAKSPKHYQHYLKHRLEPTPAMRIGSMAHKLMLGGPREYVTFPGKVRRGKAWEEFKAEWEPQGVEIVSKTEYATALAVADALRDDRNVQDLLHLTDHEVPLRWKIGERDCEGMADILSNRVLADLKVTNDANPDRFKWHAMRMQWPQQLAWYENGAIASGIEPMVVSIIAVEPKPPHPIVVYDLTENALDYGRRNYNLLLNQLQVCEENNHWPGYVSGIASLDVPDDDELTLTIGEEEVAI
jgi:hypothetical protein